MNHNCLFNRDKKICLSKYWGQNKVRDCMYCFYIQRSGLNCRISKALTEHKMLIFSRTRWALSKCISEHYSA